jgi:DNA-binding transcriptional MerR regulator
VGGMDYEVLEFPEIEIFHPQAWLHIIDVQKEAKKRPSLEYGNKQIQRIAKVTKTQILNWTQRGAIIPLKDSKGRGDRRVYSHQNLLEMMLCRELSRLSVETNVMKQLLSQLRVQQWNFEFKACLSEESWMRSGLGTEINDLKLDKDLAKYSFAKTYYPETWKKKGYPDRIIRKHTVWEYLELYPNIEDVFFSSWVQQQDNETFVQGYQLCSVMNIDELLSNCTATAIINFGKLLQEAGGYFYVSTDDEVLYREGRGNLKNS